MSLALVALVLLLPGCQISSLDPTENLADVTIVNDGSVPVSVVLCEDSRCRDVVSSDRSRLAPGAADPVNVSRNGEAEYYRVEQPGQPASCLRLIVKGRVRSLVVPVSSAGPCTSREETNGWSILGVVGVILGWSAVWAVVGSFIGINTFIIRGAYARLRRPPFPDRRAQLVAGVVGIISVAGGWVVVSIWWLAKHGARLIRRRAAAA